MCGPVFLTTSVFLSTSVFISQQVSEVLNPHDLYHEAFTGLWILCLGMYLYYLDTENKLWKKLAHREPLSENNPHPLVPTIKILNQQTISHPSAPILVACSHLLEASSQTNLLLYCIRPDKIKKRKGE